VDVGLRDNPASRALLDRANSILSDMEELATYRDHYVHGLWGHFVSASPLTRRVEKIKLRNEVPDGLWHSWIDVSLDDLETFLRETNRLNTELSSFADILIPLRGEAPTSGKLLLGRREACGGR
jgi:hypothetical protein